MYYMHPEIEVVEIENLIWTGMMASPEGDGMIGGGDDYTPEGTPDI